MKHLIMFLMDDPDGSYPDQAAVENWAREFQSGTHEETEVRVYHDLPDIQTAEPDPMDLIGDSIAEMQETYAENEAE